MLDFEIEVYDALRTAVGDQLSTVEWSTGVQSSPSKFPTVALEMTTCPECTSAYDRPEHFFRPSFTLHVYTAGDKLLARRIHEVCQSFLGAQLALVRTFGPAVDHGDSWIDMYSIYDGNIFDDAGRIYRR